jgi:uncharacterized protein YhfF
MSLGRDIFYLHTGHSANIAPTAPDRLGDPRSRSPCDDLGRALCQSWVMVPTTSFGYEGDGGLGDRLLAAMLRGEKTATSSLAVEYLSGEPLPRVGQQSELVDHARRRHGMIETIRVRIIPLDEAGDDVAREEGEDFADAAEWRRAHEAFWGEAIEIIRAEAGDSTWELRDSEPVVVEWFRLLDDQGPSTD